MSDLISRQDAIDAVNKRLQDPADFGNIEYRSGLYESKDIIKALPSTDITETEACQKCQETTDRVLLNQLKRIKALESAEKTGKWLDRSEGGRVRFPWWESDECDKCGYYGSAAWEYCPNCGSKNGR